MDRYVLNFGEIDQTQVAVVGGKGALLGELSRIDGVEVPAGFCVTTHAYERILADAPSLDDRLDRLTRLTPDDRDGIGALGAEIRLVLEAAPIPDELVSAITRQVLRLGERPAYAVRSSATAEDSPVGSFAGQHDTYLNVAGLAAILEHVRRCWASLFTDRAITYRLRNGLHHRDARMAVVVQRMLVPSVAGTMFTADPVTSNRKVASIEASFGLGEGLVSGLVNADVYTVSDGEIVAKAVAVKQLAIEASPSGGTERRPIAPERQDQQALTDAQIVGLAQLGRRIEAHFGRPQDIEWCLTGGALQIVQSRPITTLFPIPAAGDQANRLYVSVGHQQMMTDAMKPLGLSLWLLTTPREMFVAAGRLFVDVATDLGAPTRRAVMLRALGQSDPLIGDALQTVLDRGNFIPAVADETLTPAPALDPPAPIEPDQAIVAQLIAAAESSLATLKSEIKTKSGSELIDFVIDDINELKRVLFDRESLRVIIAAMHASMWLNEHLEEWLGERNAVDTLTQSVPDNITSEMGLALLDVADVIRPHPEVVAFLHDVDHESFLDQLPTLPGGQQARDAIKAYLDRYGMRCIGEIDVTRPRWSEHPTTLVPMILSNVKNFEPGAGKRRFEQGRSEAEEKAQELLARLRALSDGEEKAAETKRRIDLVRTFIGYREYPKYGMISRYFVYKQAVLEEAKRLVQAGVLRDHEDVFYLTFQELQDVTRTHQVEDELIRERKEAFRSYQPLTPPRVMTSDGEVITGSYRRDDVPAGALVGLAVSAGTIEGRARVILDVSQADLEPGDILVTAYTDPSWTPLFVTITGLVTEVGGLMTHGAVIAREYGLPAVVGVERATHLIRDGQRIRVHGTDGYVEILT